MAPPSKKVVPRKQKSKEWYKKKNNQPGQIKRNKENKKKRKKLRKEANKRCVRCLKRNCANHYQKQMCGKYFL